MTTHNNSVRTKQTAMDLPQEELQSPKTFYFRNLLILPFCWNLLFLGLFYYPLRSRNDPSFSAPNINPSQLTKLLVFHFGFLILLFAFPFLAAVASLYTSKSVLSFASTIPGSVFKRFFITYLWFSLIRVVYDVLFLGSLVLLLVAVDSYHVVLLVFGSSFVMFHLILADDASLWNLASKVSLLEPVYGFATIEKFFQSLNGRNRMAAALLMAYLLLLGIINGFFASNVVIALVGVLNYEVFVRFLVGSHLGGLLVIVIYMGLVVIHCVKV